MLCLSYSIFSENYQFLFYKNEKEGIIKRLNGVDIIGMYGFR